MLLTNRYINIVSIALKENYFDQEVPALVNEMLVIG